MCNTQELASAFEDAGLSVPVVEVNPDLDGVYALSKPLGPTAQRDLQFVTDGKIDRFGINDNVARVTDASFLLWLETDSDHRSRSSSPSGATLLMRSDDLDLDYQALVSAVRGGEDAARAAGFQGCTSPLRPPYASAVS